jgi:uncharacterized membrane protein YtjA (UPF0391 family)
MFSLILLAVFFLILALVAFILGARAVAGFSMEIAKVLIVVFVILAVLVFLLQGRIMVSAILLAK